MNQVTSNAEDTFLKALAKENEALAHPSGSTARENGIAMANKFLDLAARKDAKERNLATA